jgi:hypothetical protein
MPNKLQEETYEFICAEIKRLRGPDSYVQPAPQVTALESAGDRATFRINDAHVSIDKSGKLVDSIDKLGKKVYALPDCPRYADGLLKNFLPAIAADLLMEGNPHKPFLHINSHTPESFEAYLQTGIPFEKKLPSPIAIVSRKLGNEENRIEGFNLLLDLFDVVIRFIVLVQIADHFRRSPQTAELDKYPALSELSKPPTLGTWVELFLQFRRCWTQDCFLKEKENDALKAVSEKWLRDFVKLRNRSPKGHGPAWPEALYRLEFQKQIGPVEELLHTVSFLKSYWLVKPLPTEHDGTHHRIPVRNLMGDNPIFDTRHIRSARPLPLPTYKVIYLSPDLEPLMLEPYVILDLCSKCDREELLLFNSLFWKNISYVGYESCPRDHFPSFANAHELPQALREATLRTR